MFLVIGSVVIVVSLFIFRLIGRLMIGKNKYSNAYYDSNEKVIVVGVMTTAFIGSLLALAYIIGLGISSLNLL